VPRGRPSPKLAISVDADVHERVLAAAAAAGLSVSAWMTAAARRALVVDEGLRAVAEWEAEHGALTGDELDEARRRIAAETRVSSRRSA
jgi:DNA-binding IclR family transcriptional regulator